MNAYKKALELGITGTDAEIVLALRATGLTGVLDADHDHPDPRPSLKKPFANLDSPS